MREFLVVYDYGHGGLWAYVSAESAGEITDAFPELTVIPGRPDWLTPELEATLDHLLLEQPSGLLANVLRDREQAR